MWMNSIRFAIQVSSFSLFFFFFVSLSFLGGFRTFQSGVLVLLEMEISLTSEGNSRNGLKLGGNLQKLGTVYTYPYFSPVSFIFS